MSDDESTDPVVTVLEVDGESTEPVVALLHVEVESGGHRVVINAPDPLLDIAKVALELWRATDDKAIIKGYGAVGLHTELAAGPVVEGDGDTMGFRVT